MSNLQDDKRGPTICFQQNKTKIKIKDEPPDPDVSESDKPTSSDKNSLDGSNVSGEEAHITREVSKEVSSDKENKCRDDVTNVEKSKHSCILQSRKRLLSEKSKEQNAEHVKKKRKRSAGPSKNDENTNVLGVQDSTTYSLRKKDTYTCSVCGIVKSNSLILKRHVEFYNSPAMYMCRLCGNDLSSLSILLLHNRKCTHRKSDRRKYNCNFCNRTFKAKPNLQAHLFHCHGDLVQNAVSNIDELSQETFRKDTLEPVAATNPEDESRNSSVVLDGITSSCDISDTSKSPPTTPTTAKMRQTTLAEFIPSLTKKQPVQHASPQETPRSTKSFSKFGLLKKNALRGILKSPSLSPLQPRNPKFVKFSVSDKSDNLSSSPKTSKPFVQIHVDADIMLALLKQETDIEGENILSTTEARQTCNETTNRANGELAKISVEQLRSKFKCKDCVIRLRRCDEDLTSLKLKGSVPKSVFQYTGPIKLETRDLKSDSRHDMLSKNTEFAFVNQNRRVRTAGHLSKTLTVKSRSSDAMEKCNRDKKFACKLCKKAFWSKENLREHKEVLHVAYISSICRARFTTMNKLVQHYLYKHKSTKRNICCVCYEQIEPAMMPRHLIVHCTKIEQFYKNNIPVDLNCIVQRKRYRCNVCGKRYWLKKCLKQHQIVRSHGSQKQKQDSINASSKKFSVASESECVLMKTSTLKQEDVSTGPPSKNSPVKTSARKNSPSQDFTTDSSSDFKAGAARVAFGKSNCTLKHDASKHSPRKTSSNGEPVNDSSSINTLKEVQEQCPHESSCSFKKFVLMPVKTKKMVTYYEAKELSVPSIPNIPRMLRNAILRKTSTASTRAMTSSNSTIPNATVASNKPSTPQISVASSTSTVSINQTNNVDINAVTTVRKSVLPKPCDTVTSKSSVGEEQFVNGLKPQVFNGKNEKFPCSICDAQFHTFQNLYQHERTYCTLAAHKCETCDTSFTTRRLLLLHILATHSKNMSRFNFYCRVCNQGFMRSTKLRIHERHFHNTSKKLANVSTVCIVCKLMFESYDQFIEHNLYYYKGQTYTCVFCSETFEGMYMLYNHCKKIHYPEKSKISYTYVCDICNEGFNHESHYHAHKLHLHLNHPSTQVFLMAMQDHNYTAESSTVFSMKAREEVPIKVYTCDTCCLSFANKDDLSLHQMEYSPDGDFQCNKCSRKCINAAILTKHQSLTHCSSSINSSYKCRLCEEVLTTSKSMLAHKRHFHGQKEKSMRDSVQLKLTATESTSSDKSGNDITCLTCGITFENKISLKNHMLEYTDIGNYVCHMCHRKFAELEHLKCHKEKHLNQDNKLAHKCPICLEGCTDLNSVRIHVLHLHKYTSVSKLNQTVRGEKAEENLNRTKKSDPVANDNSNEKIARTASLDTLLQEASTSNKESSVSGNSHINVSVTSSPDQQQETKSKCLQCNEILGRFKQVSKHRLRFLNREYACSVCGITFPWLIELMKHFRRHLHRCKKSFDFSNRTCSSCNTQLKTDVDIWLHSCRINSTASDNDLCTSQSTCASMLETCNSDNLEPNKDVSSSPANAASLPGKNHQTVLRKNSDSARSCGNSATVEDTGQSVHYICPVCNLIYPSLTRFKTHFILTHAKTIHKLLSSTEPVDKIKCIVCSVSFTTREHFKEHMAKVHGTTLRVSQNKFKGINPASDSDIEDQVEIVWEKITKHCTQVPAKKNDAFSNDTTSAPIRIEEGRAETVPSENVNTTNQLWGTLKVRSLADINNCRFFTD